MLPYSAAMDDSVFLGNRHSDSKLSLTGSYANFILNNWLFGYITLVSCEQRSTLVLL